MRRTFSPVLLLVLAACAANGLDDNADESEIVQGGDVVYLDQGWSTETRDSYQFANQGMQIVPYAWLIALERETNQERFATPEHLARFGFLRAAPSAANPDGLPVGFTRDDDPQTGAWAGLTCAGCHTGEFSFKGQSFRVDGAQGRAELGDFLVALGRALTATANDESKFDRFADRVLGKSASASARDQFRAELHSFTSTFTKMAEQTAGKRRLGPGRADTLNGVYNAVTCRAIGVEANCGEGSSATIAPALWLTSDLEWVQTNGNQHTPLVRDMIQAFTHSKLTFKNGKVEHSVRLEAIRKMEDQIQQLKAPKWPEHVFGPIDATKAAAGKVLYERECASCHSLAPYEMTAPNQHGNKFIAVKRIPAQQLGVDTTYIQEYLGRRVDPGPLAGTLPPEHVGPDGKVPAVILTSAIVKGALTESFTQMQVPPAEQLQLLFGRESKKPTPDELKTFLGRPLPGVALSGHYLHNGSVRTMYQLLLPPGQREKKFYVGSTEYDPVHLGYVSDPKAPNAYEFDVTQKGDSNSGHDYGTALTDTERFQLIEFIKTL